MIKVAIFEDNKQLRQSLERLINAEEDMTCCGAFQNANHLMKDIERDQPHVVLMDINMPGTSGIEAARMIKTRFAGMRILMQTVFDDNDKIFASICAGSSGYILKKSSGVQVIDAIRETHAGGAPMTGSVASKVLEMFRQHGAASGPGEFIDLSDREKEILGLLVKGKSYKMIADECFISADTVRTHIRHIYEKLHVHSKSEAVAKAIFRKLV